jgi:hypothetical protein
MDLVTLVAACAFGMRSALLVPLGTDDRCNAPVAPVADIAQDGGAGLVSRWAPYIAEASRRFGVPEQWVRAVMHAESGGRPDRRGHPITSPAGAMGLMQVMPETYAEFGRRYRLGDDPYDPRNSILAGTAYIRQMYDRFGASGFAAADDAGPRRFADHLRTGRPLPAETRRYLIVVDDLANGSSSPAGPADPLPPSGASGAVVPPAGVPPGTSPTAAEPPILRAIRAEDAHPSAPETAGDSALFVQPSRSASVNNPPSAMQSFGQSDAWQRAVDTSDTAGGDGLFVPLGTASSRR